MFFHNCSTVAFNKYSVKPFDPFYFYPNILTLLQIWIEHPSQNRFRGVNTEESVWVTPVWGSSKSLFLWQVPKADKPPAWHCLGLLCFRCPCCLCQLRQKWRYVCPPKSSMTVLYVILLFEKEEEHFFPQKE